MIKLSIIILSYNTKDLLVNCLESLNKVVDEVAFEVIVVDNNSTDGSIDIIQSSKYKIQSDKLKLRVIENSANLGFAKGNNKARKYCKGEYVLFLNSDTEVHKNTLKKSVEYLESHPDVGVVTCKMILPNGNLDKDARRSFPTPWVSLTHLILKLDKLFPTSKYFARYWYGFLSPDITHEIEVAQGAYFLTRKNILDKVGWFDEDYFLDGEDIDLCFKIKGDGHKIVYYPDISILHVKKASKSKPNMSDRRRFVTAGVDSMAMFYKKRMFGRYPYIINMVVLVGIKIIKYFRIISLNFR